MTGDIWILYLQTRCIIMSFTYSGRDPNIVLLHVQLQFYKQFIEGISKGEFWGYNRVFDEENDKMTGIEYMCHAKCTWCQFCIFHKFQILFINQAEEEFLNVKDAVSQFLRRLYPRTRSRWAYLFGIQTGQYVLPWLNCHPFQKWTP